MSQAKHFLLIDDSIADHLLAQEAFKHLCPEYRLTCVQSGSEGLALLRTASRSRPNVVLLDAHMPGLNGFEVLAAMKQDAQLRRIPVVMLSGAETQAEVTRAYDLHASSFVVKASDFGTFMQQMEKLVDFWKINSVAE